MSAVGSILTNTGALTALQSIAQTSQNTNQLQDELASGLSINSPADNPAGYITAQGFTSQINGLTQATSNANQGVSLMQTAQSAVGQQISVVQQLNSIAVQAANGTQTPSESQSLQTLVEQLTGQVSTIANQTQFNNINLLDGSFSGTQFQVGANEGQTLNLSINSTTANSIGMNTSTSLSSIYKGPGSATADGSGSGALTSSVESVGKLPPGTVATGSTLAADLANPAITLGTTTISLAGDGSANAVVNAINAQTKNTGVTAVINSGTLSLTSTNTSATAVTVSGANTAAGIGTLATSIGAAAGTVVGSIAASSTMATGATLASDLASPSMVVGGTTVSLAGLTTLSQVTQAINNAGLSNVTASSGGGTTLTLSNTSASAVNVTFAGTTGTALGLGSVATSIAAGTVSTVASGAFAAGTATITGYNGGTASISTMSNESAASIAQAVNADSAQTGVAAQATTSLTMAVNNGPFAFTLQAQSVGSAPITTGGTIGAATNIGSQVSVSATSVAQAVSQINATSSSTGIIASQDKNGNLVIKQSQGQNIGVNVTAGNVTTPGGGMQTGAFTVQGQVQLQSAGGFSVSGGAAMGVGSTSALQSLNNINVSTSAGANKAINVVKYALQGLNNQDGQLGAVQQRMTATIANLSSTSTNASTALGVVQDANIPAVANQLTQAQIQAQSGVAALKSSTQLQQTYLSLLP